MEIEKNSKYKICLRAYYSTYGKSKTYNIKPEKLVMSRRVEEIQLTMKILSLLGFHATTMHINNYNVFKTQNNSQLGAPIPLERYNDPYMNTTFIIIGNVTLQFHCVDDNNKVTIKEIIINNIGCVVLTNVCGVVLVLQNAKSLSIAIIMLSFKHTELKMTINNQQLFNKLFYEQWLMKFDSSSIPHYDNGANNPVFPGVVRFCKKKKRYNNNPKYKSQQRPNNY